MHQSQHPPANQFAGGLTAQVQDVSRSQITKNRKSQKLAISTNSQTQKPRSPTTNNRPTLINLTYFP
ncbi:hypothetical protein ACE1CA_25250 [Aerosakkonemataceae cyanobacterium BLCC-F167]|uniref:Uncharacterized protein n=1 Tax=Floridaenema evergladense BLCC-F167 TaxID=3153639 RepID=A0ABV4WRW2_9CYAN